MSACPDVKMADPTEQIPETCSPSRSLLCSFTQAGRQAGRQTDRQAGRQAGRQNKRKKDEPYENNGYENILGLGKFTQP
jgi:hypothetical protein